MAMSDEEAHEFAREHGTSWVYAFARFILTPIAKVWFRLKVTGSELVPAEGPVIVAPNHKSIVDPFFIGLATKRRLHFMAKAELFEGRSARVLSGLGAYPVRRGTADPEALETVAHPSREGARDRAVPGGHAASRSRGAARHHGAAPGGWRSSPRRRSSRPRSPAPSGSRARPGSRWRSRRRSSPPNSK